MKKLINKIICKIFGHRWTYGPKPAKNNPKVSPGGCCCWCKHCKLIAPNQWEIYQKYFQGKAEGKYIKEVR